MLHTRLADAASHYTNLICQVQPRGPYFLAGLCIGGFVAFEVARRLRARGEVVGLVALIDAAHVKATPRSLTVTRLGRASASVRGGAANEVDGRATRSPTALERILPAAKVLGRKTRNLIAYELRTRSKTTRNAVKVAALRYHLDRGLPLPRALEKIPVSVILRSAEREYVVPQPYPGEVVLFRATRKDRSFDGTLVDDTPYVDLFREPLLGWQGRARRLLVHDNPGGHSSMLQEPNVGQLAERIQSYIDLASSGHHADQAPVTERRSS
jgi:thioesterase domain-containing protein